MSPCLGTINNEHQVVTQGHRHEDQTEWLARVEWQVRRHFLLGPVVALSGRLSCGATLTIPRPRRPYTRQMLCSKGVG